MAVCLYLTDRQATLNNSYCTNGKDIISLPSLVVLPLSCYIRTGVSTFPQRRGGRLILLGLAQTCLWWMKFSALTRKCIWKLELMHDTKKGREEKKQEPKCIILPSICLSVIIRKGLYQNLSCKLLRGWDFIVPSYMPKLSFTRLG